MKPNWNEILTGIQLSKIVTATTRETEIVLKLEGVGTHLFGGAYIILYYAAREDLPFVVMSRIPGSEKTIVFRHLENAVNYINELLVPYTL